MPAVPLLGPVPIKAGRCILNPKPDRCFACTPIYEHERQWIPKSIPGMARNLVLCFDGTGDSFDKDVSQLPHPGARDLTWHFQNSNVVQFLAMLKKDDPEKQLVYYQVIILSLHALLTIPYPVFDRLVSGLTRLVWSRRRFSRPRPNVWTSCLVPLSPNTSKVFPPLF